MTENENLVCYSWHVYAASDLNLGVKCSVHEIQNLEKKGEA